jgi:hypothetical protein
MKGIKGTQWLWKLLTNRNKKKIDHETYNTWRTKKGNFTEKDLSLYKDFLKKTRSIYQNNDPSTKNPKPSSGKIGMILYHKYGKKLSHLN